MSSRPFSLYEVCECSLNRADFARSLNAPSPSDPRPNVTRTSRAPTRSRASRIRPPHLHLFHCRHPQALAICTASSKHEYDSRHSRQHASNSRFCSRPAVNRASMQRLVRGALEYAGVIQPSAGAREADAGTQQSVSPLLAHFTALNSLRSIDYG